MEHLPSSASASWSHPVASAHHAADTVAADRAKRSTRISMQALVQRLSLMADLELPCTICLGDCLEDQSCSGVIRTCFWRDGCLDLSGDGFSLHLVVDHIESLHLVNHRGLKGFETTIEIYGGSGALLARILGTPDPQPAAVWQDIMDSFTFVAV